MNKITCLYCKKDHSHSVRVKHSKKFCSFRCAEQYKKENTPPNNSCRACGKSFYVKPSHLSKSNYCSKRCHYESKRTLMAGEGNHQFGLRGERNCSWEGGKKISSYGYILIYVGRVESGPIYEFEHRLVMEKHVGRKLGRLEVVHHKNHDKQDNRLENLELMTLSEHTTLHNIERSLENKL